jgi:SLT domain-containing protein
MASYGSLRIAVAADTRAMTRDIASASARAGAQARDELGRFIKDGTSTAARQAGRSMSADLSRGMRQVGGIMKDVGKAAVAGLGVATAAAAGFGVASFRAAARVGEMDATLRALAKANGLSYPAMQKNVAAIKAQGIETGVAQNLVAQFARNQLDLAKSTDLATVAQDAAVISGQNSSETLDQLTHGIMTQNSLVLRNAGVNVQAGKAMDDFARSMGKTRAQLTEAERSQAVLNAVIQSGSGIAGAYAAAMEEPGKVLRSFPRLYMNIKESVGKGLVEAFGPVILQTYKLVQAFAASIDKGGKLEPVFTAIRDVAVRMAGPLLRLVDNMTRWLRTLRADDVRRFTDVLRRFGPMFAVAGAGAATFTGAGLAQKVPVIGDVLKQMTGPLKQVSGGMLDLGREAVRTVVPGLSGMLGPAKGLGSAFGSAAGPVGLAVAAFGLLVATSPEFRRVLVEIARELLNALRPAFEIVMQLVRDLVPVIRQLGSIFGGALAVVLRTSVVPALQILSSVLNVLRPILPGLIIALVAWKIATLAQAAAQWALNSAILANPLTWLALAVAAAVAAVVALIVVVVKVGQRFGWWSAIGNAVTAAMRALWGFIQRYLIPVIKVLLIVALFPLIATIGLVVIHWRTLQRVTQAVWDAIKTAVRIAWDKTIKPVLDAVVRAAAAVGAQFRDVHRNWIKPAWDGVATVVRSVYDKTIKPVFDHIKTGVAAVGRAFEGAQKVIANAWHKVRDAVAGPARWVAFSIINPLLKGANKLLSKIGLTIPVIPKFAHGGRVPGGYGGGDRILAAVEPGEWVLTKEQARAIGYGRLSGLPRYAEGGMVGPGSRWGPVSWAVNAGKRVGGGFGKLMSWGKDQIVDPFSNLLQSAAAELFKAGTKPLRKMLENVSKAPVPPRFWNQVFGKFGLRALDGLVKFIEGKVAPDYEDLGVGGVGIAALAAEVMRRFPGLVVTSALRRGDPGYHGRGWARDLGGSVPLMKRAAAWMQKTMAPLLLEGIFNPGLSVKNGKRVSPGFWGARTWAGHADHIHMASRPSAGPPGSPGMAGGPGAIRKIVAATAQRFGVPWAVNLAMARIRQESGFNPRAVNRWDSNWRRGTPSVGLAQLIRPTYLAYRGPFTGGPWLYGVSIDPRAQIFGMFNYSIRRYGKSGLMRAWSGTKGYAAGGLVSEPVAGFGLRSGRSYAFGERGPEWVSPLTGPDAQLGQARDRRGVTVNVYPRAQQSELEIAAAVSRQVAWAEAGGRR